ncbi:MAG: hypothetical protein WB562_06750 [Candidatus Sulfotelmatobacter sp.]
MRRNRLPAVLFNFLFIASVAALLVLPACSVNVKKEANGEDKQVDIKTLVGGIHVSNDADNSDVGLAVYPGARLKAKEHNGDSKSANVNISSFGFALKVVALEYESDDSPAKIVSFYKDQLRKYGSVLECHTSNNLDLDMKIHSSDSKNTSNELVCEHTSGANTELKVGKKDDQHIVAIEPQGKGSSFSLVYVRTHGKDADI